MFVFLNLKKMQSLKRMTLPNIYDGAFSWSEKLLIFKPQPHKMIKHSQTIRRQQG